MNVISLNIPPLRERKEDIGPLADSFVLRFSKQHNKECDGISAEARRALHEYTWPGNVRELRNVIERGIITMNNRFIELRHLPPEITGGQNSQQISEGELCEDEIQASYVKVRRREIAERLMKEYDGNKSKVAKKMGIARTTLYRLLKDT